MESGIITVVGSTNVDFIMKVPALPRPGETVSDGEFMQVFGGKGANQAVAAARAGGRVSFVTCLGDDLYAPRLQEAWRADGMDTSPVRVIPNRSCGTALIMFDHAAENFIAVSPGANADLTPDVVRANRDLLTRSAMVVLQMEVPAQSILEVLDLCAETGTKVLLNYAPARVRSVPIDRRVSVLVVNEVEASMLLDGRPVERETAAQAAMDLHAKGPACVVVTLGAAGVVLADESGTSHVPSFRVTPVDTTAAGDTFCGAFAVALVEGKSVTEAATFASAAAALAVSAVGAQTSIPRRDAIERMASDGRTA